MFQGYGSNQLYIRGDGFGLNWTNGTEMEYLGYDAWTYNITYSRSIDGYRCQECQNKTYLTGTKFQYRIFHKDLWNMQGPNFAIQLPVSASSAYFTEVPQFTVYPRFQWSNGTAKTLVINSTYIGDERRVVVYLPPSYYENTYKSYPAIFVFDLDVNFTYLSWDSLQNPITPYGITDEYILLGFADYGDMENKRIQLMTPSEGGNMECINGTYETFCDGCIPADANDTTFLEYLCNECGRPARRGGQGDDTLDFLLYEVLPEALNLTNNRIDNSSLGIMGYSLGGLMSCYAAWTRPQYFKYAACQSPSFWWPSNENYTQSYFEFLNVTLKDPTHWHNRPNQKIYIDTGGQEIRWPFYLTDSAVEVARAIAEHELFTMDQNVWIHVSPDKGHGPVEFNARVWKALTTLYRAPGDMHSEITSGAVSNFLIHNINQFLGIALLFLYKYWQF